MPKNWKYIKKLLEKEFLCHKLRGRITYDLTDYRPMEWYQQHFIMKYGNETLLEAKIPNCLWRKEYRGYTAPRAEEIHRAHLEGVYGTGEIMDAIGIYLHSDIQSSLHGEEPFVCALAVLDRRCGKRSLAKLVREDMPPWLRRIYDLRMEA